MKNIFKTLAVAFLAITVFSCSEDDEPTMDNSITAIASRASDLSLLVQALVKTDLAETLRSGSYTVFAPTDAAFESVGYTTTVIANLDAAGTATLKEILLNHVVAGSFQASQLNDNSYIKTLAKGAASTTNTLSMYVNKTNGVRLNGVSSVDATQGNFNIIAANGVIHKVNAVITLPTVVTHATANPNFSILVAALTRADQADQNFVGILGGTASSPFTVFAPTNTAFSNTDPQGLLQEFNWADLNAVPELVLEKTLKYHVLTGQNTLASQLPATPASVTTFLGQDFMIGTTGGAKITDANARVSNIILTDVQCSNGVIHALDKVIVPNLN